MIGVDEFHVHHSIHGGWVIKRTHHTHRIWFRHKADAIKEARKLAREAGVSLYIHRLDDTIEQQVIREL